VRKDRAQPHQQADLFGAVRLGFGRQRHVLGRPREVLFIAAGEGIRDHGALGMADAGIRRAQGLVVGKVCPVVRMEPPRTVSHHAGRLLDPRIGGHFKDVKPAALKESLTDQICQLSGGPCKYEGADMKSAHADMDINKGHFNALVEVLQSAMDAQGIPFAQQNRLLALLAPMHGDVITIR